MTAGTSAGRWLWPLVVALGLGWVYHPLLADRGPSDRDLVYHYYPIAQLRAATLDRGEPLPGWNPLLNGGMPYAADPLNGALYPPYLLLALVPDGPTAFSLLILLHRLALGLLTLWLARNLGLGRPAAAVAGIVTCLGGATLSTDALQFLYAYTWIPLYLGMLVRHERSRRPLPFLGALLALVLVLLAGEPQTFYILILVTPFFWWGLGGGPRALIAGALRAGLLAGATLAVAAAAMLPLAELSSLAHRPAINDYRAATVWSFHPWRVIEFFLSRPFGAPDPRAWTFWALPFVRSPFAGFYTKSHYIGVVAFTLVLAWPWLAPRAARRLGFALSGIALAALLLGTGDYLDLYAVLFHLLPKWQLFRFPDRLLVHTLWAAGLLAALSVHALDIRWRTGESTRTLALVLIASGAALAIGSLLVPVAEIAAVAVPDQAATAAAVIRATLLAALRRSALILALLGLALAALGLLAARRKRLKRLAMPLLLATLIVDLVTANAALQSFWQNDNLRRQPAVLDRIARHWASDAVHGSLRPPRLYSRLKEFEAAHGAFDQPANWQFAGRNIPLAWGLATLTGYSSLELKRVVDFVQRVPFERMTQILGVDYVVTVPDDPWLAGREPLIKSREPPIAAYSLPGVRRDVHLATRITHAPDPEAAARRVSDPDFDPLVETVLVDTGRATPLAEETTLAQETTDTTSTAIGAPSLIPLEARFDRVAVRVTTAAPVAVILAEVEYPGWTVRVDGGPPHAPELADGVVMAVRVPAGEHEVVFEFRSRSRRVGAWASLLTLAVIGSILLISERRKPRTA